MPASKLRSRTARARQVNHGKHADAHLLARRDLGGKGALECAIHQSRIPPHERRHRPSSANLSLIAS
jgi:hypothetical protein